MDDRTATDGQDTRHQAYDRIAGSPPFAELRQRYLRFVGPAVIAFMVWYIAYVVCNNWARGLMDTPVIGHVNVAVVFGLLQFVSTFAIAFAYARYSRRRLDPLADQLRAEYDAEVDPR